MLHPHGLEPVPIYLELDEPAPFDECLDIERGHERRWDCLAGEAPVQCRHHRISRVENSGLTEVLCLHCGLEWLETGGAGP